MDTSAPRRRSFIHLIRALTGDSRTFIRQEIQLAKTELSEKLASLGRNAAGLAIGGFVAYAGLIVLLIGLGLLIGWAFQSAGLDPALANFLGLAIIGLIISGIGCILLFKGLHAMSSQSLAPARTLHTLYELKGSQPVKQVEKRKEEPKPSSSEVQARVEATENRLGETLDELGRRVSPKHINAQVKHRIQENPYRSGLLAMVAGLVSAVLLRRKLSRA